MAALLVFGLHVHLIYFNDNKLGPFLNWAFSSGSVGVSFFFILSGFVMMWSAKGKNDPRKFWWRRVARIYPVHIATAAVALAAAAIFAPSTIPDFKSMLSNAFMLHAWSGDTWQSLNKVSWSLSVEFAFYAIFPLLLWGIRRMSPVAIQAVAVVAVAAVFAIAYYADKKIPSGQQEIIYYFPLFRMPEFILGMTVAQLIKLEKWRGPGLEASMALAILGFFLTSQVPVVYRYSAVTVIGFTAMIAAAAMADITEQPSMWRKKWLVRLGELSFAFYMAHLLIINLGGYFLPQSDLVHSTKWAILLAAAAFSLALGAAWLLHEYVEKPGRDLLLRWTK
jgi:peptidoglycan/LPS O-acetylase OafA/YrhL